MSNNMQGDPVVSTREGRCFVPLRIAGSVCLELKEIFLESVDRKITITPHSSLLKESFRMLYGYLNLSCPTLHNASPLLLNIKTISDLLKGLPSLRTLSLSEYSATKPTLSLAWLPKLAPLCPQTVKSGLHMDTPSVPDARSLQQNDSECFKRPNHLDVGRSPLESSALRVTYPSGRMSPLLHPRLL
ncbi:hypothetical protein BDN71DRAFT_808378 [Pleurotus eryngii]|uniref:Uncharacterized protein n=1 Tax=Pleurotus eryngii TaxID=5323 RepID=A0A9P6DH29_PLEER|nr:hypothetical protein BDN71DRAFT_808378 [Pleurotus eryngii]